MAQQTPLQAIQRYLEDAIAAEQTFETQLRTTADDTDQEAVRSLFAAHADQTRTQHERLTARLTALGGKPSGVKGFLAHLIGYAPKGVQMGHDPAEKGTQDLIAAFAVENSEIAMYEALAASAAAVGDTETETLAREIQQEERTAAEMVWSLIASSARDSFLKVSTGT